VGGSRVRFRYWYSFLSLVDCSRLYTGTIDGFEDWRDCENELARNQSLAVFAETNEERVILKIKDIIVAQDKDQQHLANTETRNSEYSQNEQQAVQSVRQWSAKWGSSYSRIFSTNDAISMLTYLVRLGPHMRHAPFMKLATLGELVAGSHGGVSLFILPVFIACA
jgi:hypothetical protein